MSDKEDQRLRGPTPLALHGANAICTQAEPTDRPTDRPTNRPNDRPTDRRTDGPRRPLVCSTPSLHKAAWLRAPLLPPTIVSLRLSSSLPFALRRSPLYNHAARHSCPLRIYVYIHVYTLLARYVLSTTTTLVGLGSSRASDSALHKRSRVYAAMCRSPRIYRCTRRTPGRWIGVGAHGCEDIYVGGNASRNARAHTHEVERERVEGCARDGLRSV